MQPRQQNTHSIPLQPNFVFWERRQDKFLRKEREVYETPDIIANETLKQQ